MGHQSRKLLIIDDDTIVRQNIVAYLEDSGFQVFQAADGPTGLASFREHKPDLVLTDLRMPVIDGLQVLRSIHEESPDAAVIVISGAGVISDVVEALRLGASDYLIKPVVDMEMLVHSVRKTLEAKELQVQNRQYREELELANRDLKDHLRILERDQQAGRHVQQRLLPPKVADRGDYQICQRVVPSLFLSGDFLDHAYITQRYLAFYVADVSGHGASSAFVTIWLKHLVYWMVRDEGLFSTEASFESGTDDMLRQINEELHDTQLNHHLTFFVGVIDTHTNELHYSVAGHLPMPVLMSNGRAEFLEGKGKPVGIFKNVGWDIYRQRLPDDFSLACFSDGVLEILPPEGLEEKEAKLLELLAQSDGTLDNICELLALDRIEEAPDDIAIMTVSKGHEK